MENQTLNSQDVTRLDSLKTNLNELVEWEQLELSIKAGVRWQEEGERSTAFFLGKFKARCDSMTMYCLRLPDGTVVNSINLMINHVLFFFTSLYCAKIINIAYKANDEEDFFS